MPFICVRQKTVKIPDLQVLNAGKLLGGGGIGEGGGRGAEVDLMAFQMNYPIFLSKK